MWADTQGGSTFAAFFKLFDLCSTRFAPHNAVIDADELSCAVNSVAAPSRQLSWWITTE